MAPRACAAVRASGIRPREVQMRCRSTLLSVLPACIAMLTAPSLLHAMPPTCNATWPQCITLVGTRGGVPDAALGEFTVTVRDVANNPWSGQTVIIDFSACADLYICSNQLDPNMTVDCVHKIVSKVTDGIGRATFTILGGGKGGTGSSPNFSVHLTAGPYCTN